MRKILFVLCLFVVIGIAGSADAAYNRDVPPPDPADWWISPGDWWMVVNNSGGGYTIDCGLAGGCWACLQSGSGKRQCAYGLSTGSCSCADIPKEGAGPGITVCRTAGGSCRERSNP